MYSEKVLQELKLLGNIQDGLGMPIDSKIRLLVAAFRLHGFLTTASCSGHPTRVYPYVHFESKESIEFEDDEEANKLWELLQKNLSDDKLFKKYNKLRERPIKYNTLRHLGYLNF